MRRRLCALVLLTTACLVASVGTASAITGGTPDGSVHPQVGALIADHVYADGTWVYCTGTLISPTVFLTAAHCGDPGQTTARVSFSTAYQDGDRVYTGSYRPDPGYRGAQSDPHDIAVVVFAKPIRGITPATLPRAGLLDQLKKNGTLQTSAFTSVGYGSYAPQNGSGGYTYFYDDVRQQAHGSFNSLTTAWLKLSQNASTGNGGTCYGDSGGPNFLGGSDSTLLVATTITGDAQCVSTNVDYRLDTAAARAFLGKYVSLP
ncbi:MAG: trypsin-like serine protease [Frankiaceae bacterium]|nr:trypsin-like serine protease [Frankiaceae bacterium]